jgi:putative ABC transport system permease protein
MLMDQNFYRFALIRIRPGNIKEALDHTEKVWNNMLPGFPFNHGFVDARIERQYRNEQRIGKLSGIFTILAILITCIGLFAIAAHTAQEKTKEIGVRKAMGASGKSIVSSFVTIYLKWVLLANLISWPLAWVIMNNWLEDFAFHINPGIWIFLLAGLIAAAVSVITITWHAWNIARTNPVTSLRYE